MFTKTEKSALTITLVEAVAILACQKCIKHALNDKLMAQYGTTNFKEIVAMRRNMETEIGPNGLKRLVPKKKEA